MSRPSQQSDLDAVDALGFPEPNPLGNKPGLAGVLFVDQSAQLGGAELSLLDLARSIPGRVVLFEDGPFRQRLEKEGLDVKIVRAAQAFTKIRRGSSFFQQLCAFPALGSMIFKTAREARGYDVILANSQKAMWVSVFAGILSRKPVVWALRDILSKPHFSFVNRMLTAFLARWFVRLTIANSEATLRGYLEVGGNGKKSHVVLNGIDPAPFDQAEPVCLRSMLGITSGLVVGHFSRLAEWKGQHLLVQALSSVPDAHAVFVGAPLFAGEQEYALSLRRLAQDLGVVDRVHWLGFRDDIPSLMKGCDLIVHSSIAPEPFGRVIVEGMLAGKPVIAPDSGGAVEIITSPKVGLLVPPNDVCALAEAIRKFVSDPRKMAEMGRDARRHAIEFFSREAMIRGYLQVIKNFAPEAVATVGKKMQIIFIDQSGQLGGAELCLENIASAYRDCCEVLLLSEGPLEAHLRAKGLNVSVLALPRTLSDLSKATGIGRVTASLPLALKFLWRLRRRIAKAELLYLNTPKALLMAAVANFRNRIPAIFHLHDLLTEGHFSRTNIRLITAAANRCRAVIANSEATAAAFRSAGGTVEVTVIANGFDVERFEYADPEEAARLRKEIAPDGELLVGIFGRLSPWKGQHVLLEAAKISPRVHVAIVGDALFTSEDRAYADRLRDMAEDPALKGRVSFLGFRADVAGLMSAMDVVVHCSTQAEPFGRVIVEGMLARKPVVATSGGGPVEIIEHGRTGILVAPGDPRLLAETLQTLAASPDLRTALGDAGHAHASQFYSLSNILQQTNALVNI